jgi:hypothetical protein
MVVCATARGSQGIMRSPPNLAGQLAGATDISA